MFEHTQGIRISRPKLCKTTHTDFHQRELGLNPNGVAPVAEIQVIAVEIIDD
jgi:hypothetical protein